MDGRGVSCSAQVGPAAQCNATQWQPRCVMVFLAELRLSEARAALHRNPWCYWVLARPAGFGKPMGTLPSGGCPRQPRSAGPSCAQVSAGASRQPRLAEQRRSTRWPAKADKQVIGATRRIMLRHVEADGPCSGPFFDAVDRPRWPSQGGDRQGSCGEEAVLSTGSQCVVRPRQRCIALVSQVVERPGAPWPLR